MHSPSMLGHAVPAWSVVDRTTLAVALNRCRELRYGVFGSLYRASLDNLPSWLRLECRRLFCERVDAFPRLCGRLLDDDEFGEAGHKEGSRLLEFFVADFSERLDDAFDVLSRHIVLMLLSDFLNEFRLRHQLRHVFYLLSNQFTGMLARIVVKGTRGFAPTHQFDGKPGSGRRPWMASIRR